MKVLVVGSGGREHALSWKLAQSKQVDKIFCAPGNGGTSLLAENLNIPAADIDALLKFALKEKIDLTVVGPEMPLVAGIVDEFEKKGLKIFGPRRDLALLEGSKIFAKSLMQKYKIPTAAFDIFDDPGKAKDFIKRKKLPLVVKADGLAEGKGVVVCKSAEEAIRAIDEIMLRQRFGTAGKRLIVEECLQGEEASILIFTDGKTAIPLVASQDHKRVFDRDCGPNTGGMGAYSPALLINEGLLRTIMRKIFLPLIQGLNREGKTYKGVLYAGLMIKDNQPYVLEFNVRFGDPETQAILPKLKTDLAEVMLKTINGTLQDIKLSWDERFCVCVVLASGGYPGAYEKNKAISGLDEVAKMKDIIVFHAGTKRATETGKCLPLFLTNGGRVLGITALGKDIKEATQKAYAAVAKIKFEGMHYRKDIGNKALQFLR